MQSVTFVVLGPPVPLARPRLGGGHVYTPRKSKEHKERIGWAAIEVRPQDWVVAGTTYSVRAEFYTEDVSVDVDNMLKLTLDALQGVLFRNDRAVWHVDAR
jgi:Holliday junction resolvase RusA-like endonuclease